MYDDIKMIKVVKQAQAVVRCLHYKTSLTLIRNTNQALEKTK